MIRATVLIIASVYCLGGCATQSNTPITPDRQAQVVCYSAIAAVKSVAVIVKSQHVSLSDAEKTAVSSVASICEQGKAPDVSQQGALVSAIAILNSIIAANGGTVQ
jgi:hypothetical protein